MATVQEWDDFTQDAADKLEAQRQNMETILNDPQVSQTRKDEALANYEKQKRFYDLLAAKNAEIQITGIAPVSWTIDAQDINSALYQWRDDGNKYPVEIHYPLAGKLVTEEWVYATSEHFTIKMKFTQRGNNTNHMVEYSWNMPPDASHNPGFFGVKPDTNDTWLYYWTVQFSDEKGNLTSKNWTWGYSSSDVYSPMMSVHYNDIPVIGSGDVIPCGSPSAAIPIIAGYMIVVSIPQATVEDPWDYYNEELMPDINPDDRMYPNGYDPGGEDPHDPVEEPELPETDEGSPPATQDTRIITSPSWFITQYILSDLLLESLGKTLWSSWLDSTSNVWENFLFDYFQQTGTFNITAALDYIISLRVYPFDLGAIINPVPPTGFYGSSDGVYMGTGKTNFTYSSGVSSIKTINSVSGYLYMGDCEVGTEYPYNDFRDIYNTSILCYLPYCGMVELNPADVWGKTLTCHYYIDFQSGGCTAIVKCPTGNGSDTYPVASKSGQIGFTIPLTATNAGQLAAQFIGDATRAIGTLSGVAFNIGGNVSSYAQGNMNSTDMAMGIGQSIIGGGLSLADQAVNLLSRPGVNMPMLSGGSGCESLMMYAQPFITIRRGRYAKPDNYGHSVGYAIASSGRIGDYKGMNCFTGVDASGLTCHADERDAIVKLLETGVFLPEDEVV